MSRKAYPSDVSDDDRRPWRLMRDYERLPATLAGLHFVVFAILMLKQMALDRVL